VGSFHWLFHSAEPFYWLLRGLSVLLPSSFSRGSQVQLAADNISSMVE
jgi:hypothetical protein